MNTLNEFEYWMKRLRTTQSSKVLAKALEFLVGEAAMLTSYSSDTWLVKDSYSGGGEWTIWLGPFDIVETDAYNLAELTQWMLGKFEKVEGCSTDMRNMVRQAIEADDWYEDEDMDGDMIQSVYLTSVLHSTPSGKYYTPFANSNVGLLEAGMDALYNELVEAWMEQDYPDYYLTSGEGDPLDILLVKPVPEDDSEELVDVLDALTYLPYSWEEDDNE